MNGTDWERFRVEPIGWPTFLKRNLIHTDLLLAARRRADRGILEIGIGSGAQSAILSRSCLTVTVDNDLRILGAARQNLRRFGPRAIPLAADAFALPFPNATFGVAVSQGLMEHFSNERIGALLREQLRACRSVAFSVPSDHYPRQDLGDERLMSPNAWLTIVKAALDEREFRVSARYYRLDLERIKYSIRARRPLGGFNVLVTVDRL